MTEKLLLSRVRFRQNQGDVHNGAVGRGDEGIISAVGQDEHGRFVVSVAMVGTGRLVHVLATELDVVGMESIK